MAFGLRLHCLGYSRVVLAGASLYFMPYHPNYCAILYSLSCLLDALDGWAARRFNQATKFGAVLDMVTDRCTTSCLLVFLSAAYTNYAVLFQVLISLDLASHYMHMYGILACLLACLLACFVALSRRRVTLLHDARWRR